ncbi:MAG: hypothetical protein V4724_27125 [Pseudomonadota bacterium]
MNHQPIQYTTEIRADIAQMKLLEEKFDVESMNSQDLHRIFFDSIKFIFTGKEFLEECNISQEMDSKIHLYFAKIESYFNENISDEELEFFAVEAWKEHDQSDGIYKYILRTVICAMGSMEENVRNDRADFLLGFMFAFFRKFDEKYCEAFRKNIEQHPKMKKYQISR